MNERVAAVVRGFRSLTVQEKTEAFIDIEEDWKSLQQEEQATSPPPTPPTSALSS